MLLDKHDCVTVKNNIGIIWLASVSEVSCVYMMMINPVSLTINTHNNNNLKPALSLCVCVWEYEYEYVCFWPACVSVLHVYLWSSTQIDSLACFLKVCSFILFQSNVSVFPGWRRQRWKRHQPGAAGHTDQHGQCPGQEELGQRQVEVQEMQIFLQVCQQSEGKKACGVSVVCTCAAPLTVKCDVCRRIMGSRCSECSSTGTVKKEIRWCSRRSAATGWVEVCHSLFT